MLKGPQLQLGPDMMKGCLAVAFLVGSAVIIDEYRQINLSQSSREASDETGSRFRSNEIKKSIIDELLYYSKI